MNVKKTKLIFKNFIQDHEIKIHDEVMKCFQDYIYLRQNIGAFPDSEKEIERRIGMGWSAFIDNTM